MRFDEKGNIRNYPSFGVERTDETKDEGSLRLVPNLVGPVAKWGLLREGWAVPLLEGWRNFLLMPTLSQELRARMCAHYVDLERLVARRRGL